MTSVLRTLLAIVSLVGLSAAHAAEIKAYDKATFEALQAGGKPVVIHVYADWCPTCKQQTPIISDLLKEPSFKDYTVLKVNFDTQKDVRKALGVGEQSTLIVFHGKNEVARTVGDTSKASIAATLRKGLS
jgi:thiol-disulfide isomerase/thioredoxin